MKKTSMSPSPIYSSTVAEAEAGADFRNKRAAVRKSQVSEKKPEAAAAGNKLESKPSMDINESAELFIQKFRKQLLIQRLESIENYEQMLARGL
ncbi:DUF761 domain-containing protein [Melia azedarach]|uniref:DUF761 domain-containing protein n=1 Tax=Melia azedarach TaxID=155640 RepID=A0ACC1Y5Z4_MELAZ|nr:DUF761 domain-containing protein [Melia azedarach]